MFESKVFRNYTPAQKARTWYCFYVDKIAEAYLARFPGMEFTEDDYPKDAKKECINILSRCPVVGEVGTKGNYLQIKFLKGVTIPREFTGFGS